MARDYAQIRFKLWNDDDFRDLGINAQNLYFTLLTDPDLTYAGTVEWKPGRIASKAGDWTKEKVEAAAGELIEARYIVVDEDTEEAMIRSFVRNDSFMKQRNLGVSMARARASLASRGLRKVLVHELKRLHKEEPDFSGFKPDEVKELLGMEGVDAGEFPCGNPYRDRLIDPTIDPTIDPGIDPKVDPKVKGQFRPGVDPTVDPGVEGQVGGQWSPGHRPGPYNSNSNYNLNPTTATSPEGGQVAGSLRGAGARRQQSPSLIDLVDAWVAEPSSARCPKHVGVLEPEPCGGCADWRKAHQAEHDRQEAERRRAGVERREAIEGCGMCDRTGYLLPEHKPEWVDTAVPCSHDDAMEQVIEDLHTQEPEPERESRPPSDGSLRAAAALAQLRGGNDA